MVQQSQELDALKSAQADALLVGKVLTINTILERRGEDPRPEKEADQLGEFTPTGWVPIDAAAQLERQQALGTDPESSAKRAQDLAAAQPETSDDDEEEKVPVKPNGKGKTVWATCKKHAGSYPRTYCHQCNLSEMAKVIQQGHAHESRSTQ